MKIEGLPDQTLFQLALDKAGYFIEDSLIETLKTCFLDYVADGKWQDINYEEAIDMILAKDITEREMAYALIKCH